MCAVDFALEEVADPSSIRSDMNASEAAILLRLRNTQTD